jgi:chromosome segregation ATPase|tara:strand:+ start:17335 stop:17751 length:417 start_codon:yes stop_codon:yes gene_type:complete
MSRYLIAGALVIAAALGLRWLLGYVEDAGHQQGKLEAQLACSGAQTQQLQDLISSTKGLTEQAHAASTALNLSISARQQADANTTKELTDALDRTAAERAQCRFDDDSMRHTTAARDRAAEAAASGLGGAVPTAGGDE